MATPQLPPVPVRWTRKGKRVYGSHQHRVLYTHECATYTEAALLRARVAAHATDCAAIAAGKPHRPTLYSGVLAAQRGAST